LSLIQTNTAPVIAGPGVYMRNLPDIRPAEKAAFVPAQTQTTLTRRFRPNRPRKATPDCRDRSKGPAQRCPQLTMLPNRLASNWQPVP